MRILWLLAAILLCACHQAQPNFNPRLVGAPCEGCEAILEVSYSQTNYIDTLPGYFEQGEKILVKGTVFMPDGTTPAPNVILYVYHTDQRGFYEAGKNPTKWEKVHGRNRGWMRTDQRGRYAYYTIKPASYPNRDEPAHIHYTVLEPNGKYYYLDACHFAGDSLLTTNQINPDSPRGGTSGLLELRMENGVMVGTRDIILGRNIPGYD